MKYEFHVTLKRNTVIPIEGKVEPMRIGKSAAVERYVSLYSSEFNGVMEKLRETRNRSIHPHADDGHINLENLKDVVLVRENLPILRKLSHLLLQHPRQFNR